MLGEQDADVQAARQALDAWNETADPDRPAVQYERNNTLAGAVEVLYTAASDEADARAKGQLQDLHDAFTSAQATIERAAAEYNSKVESYNATVSAFPANVLAGLWGAGPLEAFAPAG